LISNERKRPKNIPRLFGWSTPQGWREGLRPGQEGKSASSNPKLVPDARDVSAEDANALVRQILEMAEPLGWRLYRGLLRTGAKSLESNRDSRRECSAQGISANAVSGTWLAAPRDCFEQSRTRSSRSDSPLLATQIRSPKWTIWGLSRESCRELKERLKAPTKPNPEPRLETAATLCLSMI
jgi:hypothetical protein